jgi:hypothetical protein
VLEPQEIISPILEILKRVSGDSRMVRRVGIQVFIGNNGGMDPEITVQFTGPYWSEEQIFSEITVWRGIDDFEAKIILMIFEKNGDEILHECVDLRHVPDAEAYFDKILTFYDPKPET